jgi:hypothetical protein
MLNKLIINKLSLRDRFNHIFTFSIFMLISRSYITYYTPFYTFNFKNNSINNKFNGNSGVYMFINNFIPNI